MDIQGAATVWELLFAPFSEFAFMRRALVAALKLRADSPGGIFTLELRGQAFQVLFRHQEPPAFEARPLVNFANPQPGDFYLATLKLMTV